MKRSTLIGMCVAVFLLLLSGTVTAHAAESSRPALWFDVGEVVTYRAYWGIILVGSGRVSSEWIEEDGRPLLSLKISMRSAKVVSRIFPVEDEAESVVDPATFLPVRFAQRIREGKRERDELTVFNHTNGTALWSCQQTKTNKLMQIQPDTRDLLSFLFHLRSVKFAEGRKDVFRLFVDDTLYDLSIAGLSRETVYVRGFGRVRCMELKPYAEFGEVFVRKGSMNVWMSEDPRRLIVKILAQIPVCNLRVILDEVDGPGNDFWTRKR